MPERSLSSKWFSIITFLYDYVPKQQASASKSKITLGGSEACTVAYPTAPTSIFHSDI